MGYRLLVNVILVVHFGFIGYLVSGGFLAWRWPRTIAAHVIVAAWGLLVSVAPVTCPLTVAEDWARRRAGQPGLASGFIDRYVSGVIYPARYDAEIRVLTAALILGSWAGWYLRRRRREAQAGVES